MTSFEQHQVFRECYKYDKQTNAWVEIGKMNYRRGKHSAVVINGSLWITGGEDDSDSWYVSMNSEYLNSNGVVKSGPDFPDWHIRHKDFLQSWYCYLFHIILLKKLTLPGFKYKILLKSRNNKSLV